MTLLSAGRAMGGSVLFQDALASRLNLMGLSRQRLDNFLKAHPAQITPGNNLTTCCHLSQLRRKQTATATIRLCNTCDMA
jgi:hypothetical protein